MKHQLGGNRKRPVQARALQLVGHHKKERCCNGKGETANKCLHAACSDIPGLRLDLVVVGEALEKSPGQSNDQRGKVMGERWRAPGENHPEDARREGSEWWC